MKRSVTIPYSASLAEKEVEQFLFMEQFMGDVDDAVTRIMADKLRLTTITLPTGAPSSLLPR